MVCFVLANSYYFLVSVSLLIYINKTTFSRFQFFFWFPSETTGFPSLCFLRGFHAKLLPLSLCSSSGLTKLKEFK